MNEFLRVPPLAEARVDGAREVWPSRGGGAAVVLRDVPEVVWLDDRLHELARTRLEGSAAAWADATVVPCAERGLVGVAVPDRLVVVRRDGRPVAEVPHREWAGGAGGAAWAGDGALLWAVVPGDGVVEDGDQLVLLDTTTWAELGREPLGTDADAAGRYRLVPLPDGEAVAVGTGTGLRWAWWDGARVRVAALDGTDRALVAVDPGGTALLTASPGEDGLVAYHLPDFEETGWLRAAAVAPDAAGREPPDRFGALAAYLPGGDGIVTVTARGRVLLVGTGPLALVGELELGGHGGPRTLGVLDDGHLLTVHDGGLLCLHDLAAAAPQRPAVDPNQLRMW